MNSFFSLRLFFKVVFAILVSVFFGTYSPDIMLVCGAISTLAAILCMIITMQKEKKYDGIG